MAVVFAQMRDHGDMGDGGGGHWWWWLIALALLVTLVVVVVWLVTRSGPPAASVARQQPRGSAEDVLADRFVRGEIDEAEYRRRRDALRE
jgi:putative membrane protein